MSGAPALQLLKLFRPSELVKVASDAFGAAGASGHIPQGLLAIVSNVDRGHEEGALCLLNECTPGVLSISRIIPITPSFVVSISQHLSVPLSPGQTVTPVSSGTAQAASSSSSSPEFKLSAWAISNTSSKVGSSSRGPADIEVLLRHAQEVQDVLTEIKRLETIAREVQMEGGRAGSHAWLAYYLVTTEGEEERVGGGGWRARRRDRSASSKGEEAASDGAMLSPSSRASHSLLDSSLAPAASWSLVKARDAFTSKEMLSRVKLWTDPHRLTIRVCTFNVNDSLPPSSSPSSPSTPYLSQLVLPPSPSPPPSLLVCGFQELDLSVSSLVFAPSSSAEGGSASREDAWTDALFAGLGDRRDEYDKLASKQYVGVLIIVLVRKELRDHIGDVSTDAIPIGVLGLMGNKAGVAVRLRIYGSYITFVNAHLAAFADQLEKRRLDYEEISRRIKFDFLPSEASQSVLHYGLPHVLDSPGVTLSSPEAGLVIFCGDLNYRVEMPEDEGWALVHAGDFPPLLAKDQLTRERATGRAFGPYEEGEIHFTPTFKLVKGSHTYDPKRLPAWCDRVLWKPSALEKIEIVSYQAHREVSMSDHLPVSATFNVDVLRVDRDRWRDVQAEVGREADRLENDATPDLDVSQRGLDFGLVRYLKPVFRSILLSNNRQTPATFSFLPSDPHLATLSTSWLWVHPSSGTLQPGAQTTAFFTVQVQPDCATALNACEERLEDILILRVEGGNDSFISIGARFEPTAFANPLDLLVRLPGPIRSHPREREAFVDELLPQTHAVSVPREIWRLIDALMAPEARQPGLFLEDGDAVTMDAIREALDTGEVLPSPSPSLPASLAFCLLELFNALPVPLVPYFEPQDACARTVSKDEAFQVLDTLPTVSANTLIYVSSFVRYHLEELGSSSVNLPALRERLAGVFARALLRPPPVTAAVPPSHARTSSTATLSIPASVRKAPPDWKGRQRFVAFLFEP